MSLQSALDLFRYATVVVTLAIVALCMALSEGSQAGRILSAGVLTFGVIQFLILTRMVRAEQARASDDGLENQEEPD